VASTARREDFRAVTGETLIVVVNDPLIWSLLLLMPMLPAPTTCLTDPHNSSKASSDMPGGMSPKPGAGVTLPLSGCSGGADKPPKSATTPRFPPSAQEDSASPLTPTQLIMGPKGTDTPGGNPEDGISCDEKTDAGENRSLMPGGNPASGSGHIPGGNPSGKTPAGGNPANGMAQASGRPGEG